MSYKTKSRLFATAVCIMVFSLAGCSGDNGTNGADGTDGAPGAPGAPGTPGQDGLAVQVASLHGTSYLQSTGEFADAGKYFATATITSASAAADGTVTVDFTVEDGDGNPVTGLTGMGFNIDKLVPGTDTEPFSKWVPYIYSSQTVSGSANGDWPNPDGTAADQGSRESNGTLTDNYDGSYTYVFATNISSVVTPVAGTAISYDRSLTHRVAVMMGGHSGATADATFDFVPDGSAVTETRNIVTTAACKNCHGDEFHGHGGDRLSVEVCVTCHNPSTTDPNSGNTVDFKVMIHKIHVGGELATIKNAAELAGKSVWELTDAERADFYAIWGYRNAKHTWWEVEFPAVIENCTKCHQEVVSGTLANVDSWKQTPSRAACGSCHDDVDFVVGTNHPGGGNFTDDSECSYCHKADTAGPFGDPPSITDAHDWIAKDQRNTQEFNVDLTVSDPANGEYFVAGESPVVSVVLSEDGINPIDHTTAVKDTDGKEGCASPTDPCPADGKFDHIYLMVHGPRGDRNPVLSTAARADIVSSTAGNFDLSAAADLQLKVDNGQDLYSSEDGGTITAGSITVDVDPAAFADPAAATPAEIVAWLNADADFAARAIAYLENGFVAIRSRNLGKFFALELEDSDVNTAVFGGDTSIYVPGGFYPSNDLAIMADPADNDPKAAWTTGSITYTLDPVDDLKPGTYIASVEITDRGRISDTNYWTPSVAKTTFQVKQAAEEPAPAGNCGSCHQGPQGTGFVLDYPRHHKIFDNTAIDQCGGCHDYQMQNATGSDWSGAKPIAKRVHAVHNGANLNYPVLTVDHADTVAGRNWDIDFPQDIRNCETCHPADTTSGSWKTEAARIPCSGCHDSDSATAHFKLMTYDPTPDDPWNGDEEESCQVCH